MWLFSYPRRGLSPHWSSWSSSLCLETWSKKGGYSSFSSDRTWRYGNPGWSRSCSSPSTYRASSTWGLRIGQPRPPGIAHCWRDAISRQQRLQNCKDKLITSVNHSAQVVLFFLHHILEKAVQMFAILRCHLREWGQASVEALVSVSPLLETIVQGMGGIVDVDIGVSGLEGCFDHI